MEDQIRWREQIQQHKHTNTKWALIRHIVKFVTMSPTSHLRELLNEDIRARGRRIHLQIISHAISIFLRCNPMVENDVDFYNTIHQMMTPEMRELLEYQMCLELPYWFAEALVDGTVPWPSNPENAFQHTTYNVDEDVLMDFRDNFPNISKSILLSSMDFDNKELFFEILCETRDTNLYNNFFTTVNYRNLKHVDEEMLHWILQHTVYKSLDNFLKTSGDTSTYLLLCDISIQKVIRWFEEYNIEYELCLDIYRFIALNPRLSMEDIEMLIANPRLQTKALFRRLCQQASSVLPNILRNMIPIDPSFGLLLSRNPHITVEDVISRQDVHWNWENLSSNRFIATPMNVVAYPELPWVWDQWGIASSHSIDEQFIETHFTQLIGEQVHGSIEDDISGVFWDGRLSNNPRITESIVNNHPEVLWNYGCSGLSSNPNITIPFFIEHLEEDWWLYGIVRKVSPNKELAINVIKGWWRLQTIKRQCRNLSKDVLEWWWSPDCKPAMKIRKYVFENQFEGSFQSVL